MPEMVGGQNRYGWRPNSANQTKMLKTDKFRSIVSGKGVLGGGFVCWNNFYAFVFETLNCVLLFVIFTRAILRNSI